MKKKWMNEYEPFPKKKKYTKKFEPAKKSFYLSTHIFTFFKFANFNCGIMIRIHVNQFRVLLNCPIFSLEMRQGKRNNEWMDGWWKAWLSTRALVVKGCIKITTCDGYGIFNKKINGYLQNWWQQFPMEFYDISE